MAEVASEINVLGGDLVVPEALARVQVTLEYEGNNWTEAVSGLSSHFSLISVLNDGQLRSVKVRPKVGGVAVAYERNPFEKTIFISYARDNAVPDKSNGMVQKSVFHADIPTDELRKLDIGDRVRVNLPGEEIVLTHDRRYDYRERAGYQGNKSLLGEITGGFTWIGHGDDKDQQMVITVSADGKQVYGNITTKLSTYELFGESGDISLIELSHPSVKQKQIDDAVHGKGGYIDYSEADAELKGSYVSSQTWLSRFGHVPMGSRFGVNASDKPVSSSVGLGNEDSPVSIQQTVLGIAAAMPANRIINIAVEVDMCVFNQPWAPPGYNITHLN